MLTVRDNAVRELAVSCRRDGLRRRRPRLVGSDK
ncbi:hypothetical protein ALC57_01402 [Trachymyrmex cornetzi]|uniref:Uncharacterized protein n=1 Tax=Trachymyrmex cornetzi TaxID=471704 RepID=A0A151JPW0_9HYME|nr:hypothetical protein ALC57_01402 [Trachymyrmex cornetzi]